MKFSFVVLSLVFLSGCSFSSKEKANSTRFEKGVNLAQLESKKLKETSGIAASRLNEGLLWLHNDSGNKPEIYLVNEKLEIQLTCKLPKVKNRDWEDIAVGPGRDSSKSYIYIGDIGDNIGRYEYKYIYRFEEPHLSQAGQTISISNYDRITVRLEEQKDVETLMVHPITNDIYLVSKREDPVSLYKVPFPYADGDTISVEPILTIPKTYIVGGDISSDGTEILLKNIDNVFYWKIEKGILPEVALKQAPEILAYEKEPQGEAIAFSTNRGGYYTVSEKVRGEKSFLRFYKRTVD